MCTMNWQRVKVTSPHRPETGISQMNLKVQWFWVTHRDPHWLLLTIASQKITAFHTPSQNKKYTKSTILNTILHQHTELGIN